MSPIHSPLQLYNIFPWLMELLPGQHHTVFAKVEKVRGFIMKKIQEHHNTLDPSCPRDYIDCFLTKLNQVWKNQFMSQNELLWTKVIIFVRFTFSIFGILTKFLPGFTCEQYCSYWALWNIKCTNEVPQVHVNILNFDPSGFYCQIGELVLVLFLQEKHIPTTEFHYENLVSTVLNLFLVGTETTSSTLRFAINVLVRYPKIQGRTHKRV